MRFRRCSPDDGIQWEMVHRPRTSGLPRAESAPALSAVSAATTNTPSTNKTKPLNKVRKSRGSAHLRDEIERATPSSGDWLGERSSTTNASGIYCRDVPKSSSASAASTTAHLPREYSSLALTSLVSGSTESVEGNEPLISLDMIEECDEILQEEETQYNYHMHSRDDTFSTVDTSVLDPVAAHLYGEGRLDENSSVDIVLWNRDRTSPASMRDRQRSESRDTKQIHRKIVVLNGDLKDEQHGSKIEVEPAMAEFCNFSKPLGKGNSVHQGNKDNARTLSRRDLSALEKQYVPYYHLQNAVPEQRREQRRDSMWEDISHSTYQHLRQAPAGSGEQLGSNSDQSGSSFTKGTSFHPRHGSIFSRCVASRADDGAGSSTVRKPISKFSRGKILSIDACRLY